MANIFGYMDNKLFLCAINITINQITTATMAEKIKASEVNGLYQGMSKEQRDAFRNQVMERCRMPYPTFYSKNRLGSYTYLEMKEVIQILQEMGITQ